MRNDIRALEDTPRCEQPLAFWLVSYPRSGNTLARITISQTLLPPEGQDDLDLNFPSVNVEQSIPDQLAEIGIDGSVTTPLPLTSGACFRGEYGLIRFVKTHCWSTEIMDLIPSLGAAYFVRHPVDVFLSGMNYMYINSAMNGAFGKYFIDNKPMSIVEIAENGQLLHYVNKFVAESGFWPFQFASGTWIKNVQNWISAAKVKNIQVCCYSDLVNNREETLKRILKLAGVSATNSQIEQGIIGGEAATKPDGNFFWRGGAEFKMKYLHGNLFEKIETDVLRRTNLRLLSM